MVAGLTAGEWLGFLVALLVISMLMIGWGVQAIVRSERQERRREEARRRGF